MAGLPYETLCEIFQLLCCEPIDLQRLQNTSEFSLERFPWAVGLVSKRWRATFLSYPPFWTSFCLGDGQYTSDDSYVAEMNRRTAMYVERSEQLPLSVVVHAHEEVQSTWRILVSLSHRWKTVELVADHTPSESFMQDLRKCRMKMPILESLKVSIRRSGTQLALDPFEIAPCLAQVDLSYLYGINLELLPLSQLKRITMTTRLHNCLDSEIVQIHSILPALRNVEELRLNTFNNLNRIISKVAPVRLDRLRVLQVSDPNALSWIEAPSLEHLDVKDAPCETHSTTKGVYSQEILHFVQRSSCHIRQLTLKHSPVSKALSIMEILTHINKLSIINFSVDHSRAIAKMPNLNVLEVICYPATGKATKMVVDEIFPLLEMWNGESRTISLERITVELRCGDYAGERFIVNDSKKLNWPSFVTVEVAPSISGLSRKFKFGGRVTINIFPARRQRLASQMSSKKLDEG